MSAPFLDNDSRLFFSLWLRNPRRIGALFPSGAALAKAVATQVDSERPGAVVELGGGTGAVSRELVNNGVTPENLVIIEHHERLYRLLAERFPEVKVIRGDAERLEALLVGADVNAVSIVLSGLPLLSMPKPVQQAILRQSFDAMGEEGVFVQYTYSPGSPVPRQHLHSLGLQGRRAARVWLNLPPASVWRYRARLAAAATYG